MKELFLLLALTFAPTGQYYSDAPYKNLWAKVDAALEAGKPQTAVTYLNQLEQIAMDKRDTLEQYQIMRTKYDCLSKYNWKEANKYYPDFMALHNRLSGNLDHYIEQYAEHPRAGALIYEKIMRLKLSEDASRNRTGKRYREIRKMCTLAAENYPKHARELLEIVSEMDSKDVMLSPKGDTRFNGFIYPGETVEFELTGRNIAESELLIYRLDDRYEVAGDLTTQDAASHGRQYSKQKIATYKNEYNISETVVAEYTFEKPGIYAIFNKGGGQSAYMRLFVSSVALATREMGGNNQIYVADARSGKPLPNATLYAMVLEKMPDNPGPLYKPTYLSQKVYTLNGFTNLSQTLFGKKDRTSQIFAEYASDMWSPAVDVTSAAVVKKKASAEVVHYIYTDRKLYRAGDTVQFKLIALSTNHETGKVLSGKKIAVSLYAPDGNKPLVKTNVTTNSMGSAAGAFIIPKDNKNGYWRIGTDYCTASFNVEAYKDPKYKLEFEKIATPYTFDETLVQKGRLLGYTGEPVAKARIEYSVETYYSTRPFGKKIIAEGEALTDADGVFEIPFTAPLPADAVTQACYYNVNVKAVARNGETCESSKGVMVGRDLFDFDIEFDNQYHMDTLLLVNKTKAGSVTVTARNFDGLTQNVEGEYRLLFKDEPVLNGRMRYGEPLVIDFASLSSGKYELECRVVSGKREQRTKTAFVLFSPDERKCPVESRMFFYPVEDKGKIDFVVASSKEIYLELELFSDGVAVYRRALHLNGTAEHIKLDYKSSYADRVTVSLFGFKDMEQISHRYEFARDVPSNNFEIKVSNLRDKTTPNTKETFTVEAPASEMLVSIYDATCDRYQKNIFSFNPIHPRYSYLPHVRSNVYGYRPVMIRGTGKGLMMVKTAAAAKNVAVAEESMDIVDNAMDAEFSMADEAGAAVAPDSEYVRDDFSQTLAFIPQLSVPSVGKAKVTFTTRDGLSTFRVAMLAHTKNLRSGTAERYFVVNKTVKIETSLPLFAVEGDRLVVNANITNSSYERVKGVARLTLTDEETGDVLDVDMPESDVTIASGETKLTFWVVKIPEDVRKMGVTVSFTSKNATDGEKHLVEILPASRTITEAESFILGSGRNKESCIRDLKARYRYPGATIRYEEHTTRETLLDVLRKPEYPDNDNMIAWLDALYVNQMRGCLLGADSIDVRFSRRAVSKLASMQKSDGGFGWFPSNPSNDLLTLMFLDKTYYMSEVGKLPRNTSINSMIEKAMGYVDKRIMEVTADKNWNWRNLTYFFAAHMEHLGNGMNSQIHAILKEYLKRCKKDWQNIPIVEKAKLCMILEATGETSMMFTVMRSMRDYAVTNSTVGCYFPNAVMPYRGMLHTELYAHSQLAVVFAEMDQMDIARGIMKWLLLQKHNQQWESNMASADAIFALIKYKAPELIFGAVYYTYTAPMLDVKASSSQMSVERTYWRSGKQLRDGQTLRVGDKVEVRYKIDNTENRSFVVMEASRPACFYPTDERSFGSHWFYCEHRGECTKYYFQILPEETTNLSETFYVTQEGTFNSGLVQIESLYAPEYRAHTDAIRVETEAY